MHRELKLVRMAGRSRGKGNGIERKLGGIGGLLSRRRYHHQKEGSEN